MSEKRKQLQQVEDVAFDYKRLQVALDEQRAKLLAAVWEAKQAGATQMEIANRTHFSRQRIAQFLKEVGEQEPTRSENHAFDEGGLGWGVADDLLQSS